MRYNAGRGIPMKTLGVFFVAVMSVTGLGAQSRGVSGSAGTVRLGGSSVAPFGTPIMTGVQRPVGRPGNRFYNHTPAIIPYPVYVGGFYDSSYYGNPYYGNSYYGQPTGQDQQQQPNVTVVYPPQPAPVIINQFGPPQGQGGQPYQPSEPPVQPQMIEPQQDSSTAAGPHYLIAFKDHSIYSAVAYWVDGDTLHYFTTGSTHNQASLALVDRELTERLNREMGTDLRLPPAKN